MQRVTIIGLGLIGGSIGLGLRKWSDQNENALRIVGYDHDMDKQSQGKKLGAVHDTQWSLSSAVSDADVVIIATPVGAMEELFADIRGSLKPGAVVTDTGSTKANVLEWAKQLPEDVSFVGGHPMAGGAESLDAARADLVEKATWVVCPAINAKDEAIRTVLGIISALEADAFFVDAEEHDAYVAGVSHLPFVVAATLVQATTTENSWRDMRSLAATGFRDTTRLALASPEMHRDIALTNREALSRWIDVMTLSLQDFKNQLNQADEDAAREAVFDFLTKAQDTRAQVEVYQGRRSEQALEGNEGLAQENLSGQMSRMFLGGFGRRRNRPDGQKNQR